MDVAGALLPFTQIARPELTIHVQEVLTQVDQENQGKAKIIPEIKEPFDAKPRSPAKSKSPDESAKRDFRVDNKVRNDKVCVMKGKTVKKSNAA